MARAKTPSADEATELAISQAGSIGDLERLAGIGQDLDSRSRFWIPFCRLPGTQSLDAGTAELKRRIRAAAAGPSRR